MLSNHEFCDIGYRLTKDNNLPYHNELHIEQMINAQNSLSEYLKLSEELNLAFYIATCFHDSFYEVDQIHGENEDKSIKILFNAWRNYNNNISLCVINTAATLIKATKYHFDEVGLNNYLKSREQYTQSYYIKLFMDLDLINLSFKFSEFLKTTYRIVDENFKSCDDKSHDSWNLCLYKTKKFLDKNRNFKYHVLDIKKTNKAQRNIKKFLKLYEDQ